MATETRNLEGQEFQVRKADGPWPEPQREVRVCALPAWLHFEGRSAVLPPAPSAVERPDRWGQAHPLTRCQALRTGAHCPSDSLPTLDPAQTSARIQEALPPNGLAATETGSARAGLLPCPHPPGHGHLHAENPVTAGLQHCLDLHQN